MNESAPDGVAADSDAVAAVRAMLDQLDHASIAEVERAMALELMPQPSAADRRGRELGLLASLLNPLPLPKHLSFLVIDRKEYDAIRTDSDPRSARLVERYGSWRRACYHAYGLLPDGRSRGPSNPWPMPLRGKPMPAPYEPNEIRTAIRACAFAFSVRPTSSTFFTWVAAKRARARERGLNIRLPTLGSVYRHYPYERGGWNAALADAEITDEELDLAWASKLEIEPDDVHALTPGDVIGALASDELRAAGLPAASVRLVRKKGAAELPLPDAVRLAIWLGVSLAWLAGTSRKKGDPPAAASRLATELLAMRRRELEVPELAMLKAAGLQLGAYRRTLKGTRAPVLRECAVFARLVGLDLSDLVVARSALT